MPKAMLGRLVAAPLWEPLSVELQAEEREPPSGRAWAAPRAPAQPQPQANAPHWFSRKLYLHLSARLPLARQWDKVSQNKLRHNRPIKTRRNPQVKPAIRLTPPRTVSARLHCSHCVIVE